MPNAPTPNGMTVAGAVIERDGGLLLVKNRRRNGAHDWSTPGGVVDPTDASILDGLAREVEEETGLVVHAWEGPLYSVTAVAIEMGWQMRCEVHRAVDFAGDLRVDDPDGIVVDASFVTPDDVDRHLADCFRWVRDPLAAWLLDRWPAAEPRRFHFDITGSSLADFEVVAASEG
jgi:8-oxo-dGTP pyrophosphatase MutT (NUDIX family)